MPWYLWFCALTAPFIQGVAFTLTAMPGDPNGLGAVFGFAAIWYCVALPLKNHLREQSLEKWIRRWLLLAVALPLFAFYTLALGRDPEVRRLIETRQRVAAKPPPEGVAPSAPSRFAPSWSETRQLIAGVRPCSLEFGRQLLTSLPPAWWIVAIAVAIWKGKK